MSHLPQNGAAVVARLRVRGGRGDPLVARQRASSLLGAARLHPPGLAPHAILCVRRLRDPLPRTLRLDGRAQQLPAAWGEAAAAALNALARRAARPTRGDVPPDAECVIFADRAELLACLAGDVCAGRESARWWWRGLFPGRALARVLVSLWLEAAEYVPGALQHLSRMGALQAFARRLGDEDARQLTEHVALRFALDGLRAALHDAARDPTTDESDRRTLAAVEDDSSARVGAGTSAPAPSRDKDTRPRAPWARWVPEGEAPELGLEQRCLLGVGLTLQRAPHVARARDFADRVRRWRSADTRPAEPARTPPPAAAPEPPDALRMRDTREAAAPPSAVEALLHHSRRAAPPEPSPEHTHAVPPPPAHETGDARATNVAAAQSSLPDVAPEFSDESKRRPQTLSTESSPWRRVERVGSAYDADAVVVSESVAEAPPLEADIETRLGGLFYLLNLGLYLDLYGDFSAPAAPGLPLNVWDFVALTGRELLGETRHDDDPVWPLLARLAGRGEGEAPGEGFAPPPDWRLPTDWLARIPARGRWLRLTSNGRLRVSHPAGFLVLDVRLDGDDPAARAETELRAYESFYPRPSSEVGASDEVGARVSEVGDEDEAASLALVGDEAASPLRRWTDLLMAYVRVRLRLALGVEDGREVGRVLCEHEARVVLTATHVDVTLGLAELPIGVRLCGLDRDPGWIPAAGRVVSFHFT